MGKEYLRAVVWPRDPITEGKKINYRYAIVGILVTDTPLDGIEGIKNSANISEILLDSDCKGIQMAIEMMPKFEQSGCVLGDASSVLCSLNDLFNAVPIGSQKDNGDIENE